MTTTLLPDKNSVNVLNISDPNKKCNNHCLDTYFISLDHFFYCFIFKSNFNIIKLF